MHQARWADLNLSRLMLGTVQLGLPYGIANRSGKPSYETARDIIRCAHEGGVNCLDTAAAYGESEAVIGRALTELGLRDRMVVVSKIRHIDEAALGRTTADAFIEQSVLESLRRLRLERLPVCLLHREQDLRHGDSLLRLKERGLIGHAGVSVESPAGASAAIARGWAEAVQFPVNLLDRRFHRGGVFALLEERGVALFARSVFLQGLLFLSDEATPAALQAAGPVRRALQETARQAGLGLAEMALRYVLGTDAVTSALAGVESVAQMRQNLEWFSKGPLPPDLAAEIDRRVPELPEQVLNPRYWPNAQRR